MKRDTCSCMGGDGLKRRNTNGDGGTGQGEQTNMLRETLTAQQIDSPNRETEAAHGLLRPGSTVWGEDEKQMGVRIIGSADYRNLAIQHGGMSP